MSLLVAECISYKILFVGPIVLRVASIMMQELGRETSYREGNESCYMGGFSYRTEPTIYSSLGSRRKCSAT